MLPVSPIVFRQSTIVALLFVALLMNSCADDRNPYARFEPDSHQTGDSISTTFAVIEVPAGTTVPQALDTMTGRVQPGNRALDFLPYPGNFGFISSTLRNGKALETIVLMHALTPESVVPVIPIGVLQIENRSGMREIIVSVPADPALQSIKVTRFADFITDYNPARYILQEWFLNHMGFGSFQLIGWQDERYAADLIERHRLRPDS